MTRPPTIPNPGDTPNGKEIREASITSILELYQKKEKVPFLLHLGGILATTEGEGGILLRNAHWKAITSQIQKRDIYKEWSILAEIKDYIRTTGGEDPYIRAAFAELRMYLWFFYEPPTPEQLEAKKRLLEHLVIIGLEEHNYWERIPEEEKVYIWGSVRSLLSQQEIRTLQSVPDLQGWELSDLLSKPLRGMNLLQRLSPGRQEPDYELIEIVAKVLVEVTNRRIIQNNQ